MKNKILIFVRRTCHIPGFKNGETHEKNRALCMTSLDCRIKDLTGKCSRLLRIRYHINSNYKMFVNIELHECSKFKPDLIGRSLLRNLNATVLVLETLYH